MELINLNTTASSSSLARAASARTKSVVMEEAPVRTDAVRQTREELSPIRSIMMNFMPSRQLLEPVRAKSSQSPSPSRRKSIRKSQSSRSRSTPFDASTSDDAFVTKTIVNDVMIRQRTRSMSNMLPHRIPSRSPSRMSVSIPSPGPKYMKMYQLVNDARQHGLEIHSEETNESDSDDDQNEKEEDKASESSDSDDDDAANCFELQRAEKQIRESIGSMVYEDHGQLYHGTLDRRGITPHVTFTTAEMPPSEVKKKQSDRGARIGPPHPVACGFCNSNNLVWCLKCSFCGCTRMGDAPRLKYLIDMILSVEPLITAEELAKRLIDYARFDRVAIKVEQKFKQASLVRAKAAIMMMNRTINMLRQQMVRMIFGAWKRTNAITAQHDRVMLKLIGMKEIQLISKRKHLAFTVWKGHVNRVIEERGQRYSIASRRTDLTRLRRIWGYWQKFMRMRCKEKMAEMKARHEAERNEKPTEWLNEIARIKENLTESRKLVFAATNTILDLLQLSLRKADHDVHKTLQVKEMYPSTVGAFFEAVHGQETLNALITGHVAVGSDHEVDDEKDDEMIRQCFEQTKAKIDKMHSSETLMQWLNFQRKRSSEMAYIAASNFPTVINGSSDARSSVKLKAKEKRKEFKEIKGLQDLRTCISSPTVMLKLLCHTSPDAQAEYESHRSTETANSSAVAAAENSTTSTTLTTLAQLHLRTYFKLVHRILNLPPDVVSKDAFTLNDFDSLYAYASYLLIFHPNYVAPGQMLSPRYHLSYDFLMPQWERVQKMLTDDEFDPFAQQQFLIFLAKVKRVHKQFLRFIDICRYVNNIARWHQEAVLRDTYNDFTRRVLGKDSNISVALEKETLASWVSLSPSRLLGLCESKEEVEEIEKVFKDHVLDLFKIFRIYGSGAGGKGILEQEFLKVMTKAGVTDKKNILRSHLQTIYQQSRATGGTSAVVSTTSTSNPTSATNAATASDENDDEVEDRGATANEFFEALVRVAHHNYQKRAPLAIGTVSMHHAGGTLLAYVVDLVVDKVIPLTKKFQEQGLTFKKQMVHPEVQLVCKAQEKRLKRVFIQYSQKNKNPNSRSKLMDLSDFETLLKDRRLLDALFPHGKLKQLAAFVQQDGDTSLGGGGSYDTENEFVFSEFVEALAAIAMYRNANPYVPFAKKLETFFEENFA